MRYQLYNEIKVETLNKDNKYFYKGILELKYILFIDYMNEINKLLLDDTNNFDEKPRYKVISIKKTINILKKDSYRKIFIIEINKQNIVIDNFGTINKDEEIQEIVKEKYIAEKMRIYDKILETWNLLESKYNLKIYKEFRNKVIAHNQLKTVNGVKDGFEYNIKEFENLEEIHEITKILIIDLNSLINGELNVIIAVENEQKKMAEAIFKTINNV